MKRYRLYQGKLQENPVGNWVKWEDVARLQAIVNKAIVWQQSFKHGRDVTDEGFSIADDAAEQALYDAVAEAARDK